MPPRRFQTLRTTCGCGKSIFWVFTVVLRLRWNSRLPARNSRAAWFWWGFPTAADCRRCTQNAGKTDWNVFIRASLNSAVRLNKYISETGVCSRREADKWIEAGRVTCNGEPAVLGTRVSDGDEVRVDGKLVGIKKRQIYIALNKPVG